MAAALSAFERFVLPFVAGAPVPAVHDAVLDAAIEFCTRTRAARQTLAPLDVAAGPVPVQIPAPAGMQLVEVYAAWLPEGEIFPATRPELDAAPGWQALVAADWRGVLRFYCPAPDQIRLVPQAPAAMADALTLEVIVAPAREATEVPDILLQRYPEQVAAGALARLHQHPASYADPARAASYLTMFDNYCTTLADQSNHGFSNQPLRTGRDAL